MSHGTWTPEQIAAYRIMQGDNAKLKLQDEKTERIDLEQVSKRRLEHNQAISDSKDHTVVTTFTLERWQLEQARAWSNEHACSITYSGAIGGQYTYQFTNTNMGQIVKVVCACGSVGDLSAYEEW